MRRRWTASMLASVMVSPMVEAARTECTEALQRRRIGIIEREEEAKESDERNEELAE